MKIARIGAALALATTAVSAQAATTITFTTTGSTSTASQQTFTNGGVTATFTGGSYIGTVAAMNNIAQGNVVINPAGTVRRSATGLGVAGDSQTDQVDSTGVNELLQSTFSTGKKYRIVSVTLGKIDNDDTFALFGGNGGVYDRLGFAGALWQNGGVTGGDFPVDTVFLQQTSATERLYRLDFNSYAGYDSFRFGTNAEEGDGFALRGLQVALVPEPSTWAMMIAGFGLVGGALRRKAKASGAIKARLATI